jgi:hypothetical protein
MWNLDLNNLFRVEMGTCFFPFLTADSKTSIMHERAVVQVASGSCCDALLPTQSSAAVSLTMEFDLPYGAIVPSRYPRSFFSDIAS